ncbi:HlyD family type I secretion periplasmic adaptor subunit [Photobacterium sanctipauli]|uniref:Membrane fusion protein (MFP) family protein n=2 Tax=Photobacterium sanctipauli TaxID=1342794 RepID=A0A2T3NPK2_9GAMM|nr:HlyD family type I secretion periplasmic adaptor subunit [Photobacterium sanctipauli]PSW18137.1 HlyD family type I secretion periplasmic adaptor subunit [Photobacterium sanctipauli]
MDNSRFSTRNIILFGCFFIAMTVGGFFVWSTTAELSSASIAQGTLVVESQRKKVQHLQGGWVKAIYVHEGQHVKAGDILIELANSKAESDFRRLLLRSASLQAQHDRINTELGGGKQINWSLQDLAIYDQVDSAELNNILNTQQLQFQQSLLRQDLRNGQYNQRKVLLEEQLRGTRFQLKAISRQLDLVTQEITMTSGLLEKGFVSKTRMLELQRHQAGIEAQAAELSAESEVLNKQLLSLEQEFKTELVEQEQQLSNELAAVEKEWRDVSQSLKAARDVRARVTIRSEHNGTVVGLNVHSIGGVINAGDVIMEIVPDSDELIVEALVKPEDIDVVHDGLEAKVRLSAYNVRRTPPVNGEVIHVAADRLQTQSKDQPTGYLVKVRLSVDEVAALGDIELYPGMPTEVFILLEEQTLWDYFTAPLFNSYYRAFRES